MGDDEKLVLGVAFYTTSSGEEPVRKWLKSMPKNYKKIIGEDIKVVQSNWPIGMPLVRNLGKKLWEIRSSLPHGIARIFFVIKQSKIVLIHAIIKKSQKTPKQDLELAYQRIKNIGN